MKFEWDHSKSASNLAKHGYDFADTAQLFQGDRLELRDDRKDYGEERFIVMGHINNRVMVAVYTRRNIDTVRIISLRKANSREKERFERAVRNGLDER